MKSILRIKPRTKKPKPVAIHNYKASYLDKRSKTYHRIVMTAFTGLFGLVGFVYVFSSSASTGEEVTSSGSFFADNIMFIFAALVTVFLFTFAVYIFVRKK